MPLSESGSCDQRAISNRQPNPGESDRDEPAGTAAVANNIGLLLQITDGNTVGGTTPAARNIISGNTTSGIDILNANNNLVQGNYIGTSLAVRLPSERRQRHSDLDLRAECDGKHQHHRRNRDGCGQFDFRQLTIRCEDRRYLSEHLLQSNTIG